MNNHQIKPNYSSEIAAFVASGGVITKAVNTNKVQFNQFNAYEAALNAEKPSSHQNAVLRKRAEKEDKKSYTPVAPCRACKTSERSVKSNVCLECDRRRFRAKTQFNQNKLTQVAEHLLTQNIAFSFTRGGKKYALKVEEIV